MWFLWLWTPAIRQENGKAKKKKKRKSKKKSEEEPAEPEDNLRSMVARIEVFDAFCRCILYSTSQDLTLAGKWRCLGAWRGLYILCCISFCLIIFATRFVSICSQDPEAEIWDLVCLFKDRWSRSEKCLRTKFLGSKRVYLKAKNEESSEQKESGALRAIPTFGFLCCYALLGYDKKYIQAKRLEFALNFCSEDWKGNNLIQYQKLEISIHDVFSNLMLDELDDVRPGLAKTVSSSVSLAWCTNWPSRSLGNPLTWRHVATLLHVLRCSTVTCCQYNMSCAVPEDQARLKQDTEQKLRQRAHLSTPEHTWTLKYFVGSYTTDGEVDSQMLQADGGIVSEHWRQCPRETSRVDSLNLSTVGLADRGHRVGADLFLHFS